MRTIKVIYIFIFILFVSCDDSVWKSTDIASDGIEKKQPRTFNLDDIQFTKLDEPIININTLLLKPFDLYLFKKKIGQSNSGEANKNPYYYKPKYDGTYYSFFLFSKLNGYLGTNKANVVRDDEGFEITTYKPLGKYQYEFYDPTEELIEVYARYNKFELPELAFVGLDTLELKKQIGEKTFYKNNCFVYSCKDRVLLFGINGKTVLWLKYIHLKSPLTKDNLPDELFNPNNALVIRSKR